MSKLKFNTVLCVDKILPNIMECYTKSIGITEDCEKKVYEYAIVNPPNESFQMQQLIYVDVVLDSKTKISLVIKVMQPGQEYFEYHYENEILMYKRIIPLGLSSMQMFPRCIYTQLGQNGMEPPMLVLQNLVADGYKMSTNKIFLSREEILLALKTLGEFHGHCYALKLKSRIFLDGFVSKIKPTYFAKDDNSSLASIRSLRRFLQMYEEGNTKAKSIRKARALLDRISKGNSIAFTKKLMEPREPLAVLTHGDYNRNNIMFRYADHARTKPTDCLIVGLQTIRYSSPMADFTFLLFMNMRADEDRPWDEMWDAYHTTLVTTLRKEFCMQETELPQYFSLSSFKEEFNKYCLCSYMIAVSFLNITVMGLDVVLRVEDQYEKMKRVHLAEKEEDKTLEADFDDYLFNKIVR